MIYRSEQWLAAVRGIGFCVLCGDTTGCQAAHRNEGKGMSVKADDCASASLCLFCHRRIDQGSDLDKESRRAWMDKAIVLTLIQLTRAGTVDVLAESGKQRASRPVQRRSKGRTSAPSKVIPHSGRPG